MLDFMICALTNLFRIFLIGRCASIFLGVDVDKKKKHIVYGCFFCYKYCVILGISHSMD